MAVAVTSVSADREGGRGTSRRARAIGRTTKARSSRRAVGSTPYNRMRDLPGLLALWPWEMEDVTLEGHRRLITLLRKSLRLERQRGIAGQWTYDVARHAQLLKAYKCEAEDLRLRLAEKRRKGCD